MIMIHSVYSGIQLEQGGWLWLSQTLPASVDSIEGETISWTFFFVRSWVVKGIWHSETAAAEILVGATEKIV